MPGPPVSTARAGAFTMVELLTVIAVIGVAMAILIPSIRRSMCHAASTVCTHHLRELNQALHTYRLDNAGWLPDVEDGHVDGESDPYGAAWFGRLLPRYLAATDILACPSDPATAVVGVGGALHHHPDPANASSYGMNDVIRMASLGNLDRYGPRRPIETLLIADTGPDHAIGPDEGTRDIPRNGGRLAWDDGYHYGTAGLTTSWLTDRHFGHINVLTIGGDVKSVPTREIMEERIRNYYGEGAAGGCPLCLQHSLPHYSFAKSRVYWWTGKIPDTDPQRGVD